MANPLPLSTLARPKIRRTDRFYQSIYIGTSRFRISWQATLTKAAFTKSIYVEGWAKTSRQSSSCGRLQRGSCTRTAVIRQQVTGRPASLLLHHSSRIIYFVGILRDCLQGFRRECCGFGWSHVRRKLWMLAKKLYRVRVRLRPVLVLID